MMESLLLEDDDDWMRAPAFVEEAEDDGGAKKRQKKVLTLDDLLEAERKETVRKLKGKKSKKLIEKLNAKSYLYSSTNEEDEIEVRIPKVLAELEKQVAVGEEVEPEYGAPVFATQLELPSLVSLSVYFLLFPYVAMVGISVNILSRHERDFS